MCEAATKQDELITRIESLESQLNFICTRLEKILEAVESRP